MKRHGVIFDCDGTLVDSLGDAIGSYNYAFDKIGEPRRPLTEIKKYFGASADRIFTSLLGSQERGLRAFEYYKEHQTQMAPGLALHSGIRELLEILAENDVPMAVVTGRHADDMKIVLDPHEIVHHFITLVADSQLPRSKPAPDGILLAASRMGLDPVHALYVGDSLTDVQAAHAAGATAVAALWDPLAKRSEMASENPRYIAQVPHEVWLCYRDFSG